MTLDDPELTLNGYYALCCITDMSFGAHHKNLNEDRRIPSVSGSATNELAFLAFGQNCSKI